LHHHRLLVASHFGRPVEVACPTRPASQVVLQQRKALIDIQLTNLLSGVHVHAAGKVLRL
jgi:hypothetical protein